jgi:glycerol-3-phosphate dehydrogenase
VVRLGDAHNLNVRLHPDYDFLKSEVLFAAKYELAQKPNDVLCRRIPIAILNKKLAEELLPEVVEIMGKEH